jgi:hypothetical protein
VGLIYYSSHIWSKFTLRADHCHNHVHCCNWPRACLLVCRPVPWTPSPAVLALRGQLDISHGRGSQTPGNTPTLGYMWLWSMPFHTGHPPHIHDEVAEQEGSGIYGPPKTASRLSTKAN